MYYYQLNYVILLKLNITKLNIMRVYRNWSIMNYSERLIYSRCNIQKEVLHNQVSTLTTTSWNITIHRTQRKNCFENDDWRYSKKLTKLLALTLMSTWWFDVATITISYSILKTRWIDHLLLRLQWVLHY